MRKWLPWKRLQKVDIKTLTGSVLCLIAVVQLFASYGYYNYEFIPREDINQSLYLHVNPQLPKRAKHNCTYDHIYLKEYPDDWDIDKVVKNFNLKGISNGSFAPEECNPLISVAILVTYRNRQKQLDKFIPYIHSFLRKQNIHYKIFLIEQEDNKLFNKGLLYNIGARRALAERFPCLVLHDVDLLPLSAANLYACLRQPRHLSAAVDKLRFTLPYAGLAGGVLALRADHYRRLDGLSNRFLGWGGEDDDLTLRIRRQGLTILRFPPDTCRYTMLAHRQERRNTARHALLSAARGEGEEERDGLGALPPHELAVRAHPLFTRLAVRT